MKTIWKINTGVWEVGTMGADYKTYMDVIILIGALELSFDEKDEELRILKWARILAIINLKPSCCKFKFLYSKVSHMC